jgi:hypothetical protein
MDEQVSKSYMWCHIATHSTEEEDGRWKADECTGGSGPPQALDYILKQAKPILVNFNTKSKEKICSQCTLNFVL